MDTVAYIFKGMAIEYFLENNVESDLPSCREANIQVAKFLKMAHEFERRFPSTMVSEVPKKKVSKTRGVYRHRLEQQSKLIDRLLRQIFEEHAVQMFPRLTPKKVRGICQKHVQKINGVLHQRFPDMMKKVFLPESKVLGKGQLKYLKEKRVASSSRKLLTEKDGQ